MSASSAQAFVTELATNDDLQTEVAEKSLAEAASEAGYDLDESAVETAFTEFAAENVSDHAVEDDDIQRAHTDLFCTCPSDSCGSTCIATGCAECR